MRKAESRLARRHGAVTISLRALGLVAAALASLAVAGCGSGGRGQGTASVVIRVGSSAVTQAEVTHWTDIAVRARPSSGDPKLAPQRAALDYLIYTHWLIEEARARHLEISAGEVSQRMARTRVDVFFGTEAEYLMSLHREGKTPDDVRLEIEAELAYQRLVASLRRRAAMLSAAEIRSYYASHRQDFAVSETRYFDIDSHNSLRATLRDRARVRAGADLAKMSIHENVARATAYRHPGKVAIERAIFAARLGRLYGPYTIEPYKLHSIFIVRRIVPPTFESLRQARPRIRARLVSQRTQEEIATFDRAWRAKWVALTRCSSGFVVPKCRAAAHDGNSAEGGLKQAKLSMQAFE